MEDLFKKFIYTSVGLVAHTADKIQQSVNKLIEENKISSEEGKKIVDDFVKNTQAKKEEFEGSLKNIIKKLNYAKTDEMNALKDRVELLEIEVHKIKSEIAKAGTPTV